MESAYHDEIVSVMEDNSPESIRLSPDLMKTSIQKIEILRMQYRSTHRELKMQLEEDEKKIRYGKPYSLTITRISSYIQIMNRQIQGYQESTYEATRDVDEKKTEFIIEELRRSITYLQEIADCDVSKIEN